MAINFNNLSLLELLELFETSDKELISYRDFKQCKFSKRLDAIFDFDLKIGIIRLIVKILFVKFSSDKLKLKKYCLGLF